MVKLLLKKIRTIIKVGICLALVGVVVLVVVFFYLAKDLPDLNKLTQPEAVESTKIYDRTGTTLLYDVYSDVKRTSLKSEEIPQKMIDVTISIEDKNFLKHSGLSFKGIFRAIGVNLFSGKVVQGGSTITQQLIKNSFLTPERTITRKIKEVILAYQMERQYSKKEIITSYLNTISYGSGSYGIEAASQTFFGKPAKDASLSEMALLAALPKAPSYFSPYGSHLDELIQRRNSVLDKTAEANLVTREEALFAKKEIPQFVKSRSSIRAPHFVMYVKEYLSNKYGEEFIDKAGLKVITTIDYPLQTIAEEIIKKSGEVNEKKFQAKNAGLVATDPKTGQILVMVGSRDYFDVKREGNFNVTTAQRQPGSSFKPFVYALALKKGYLPETVIFDLPTEFNPLCTLENGSNSLIIDSDKCYHPENFDSKYRGPVTLKEAIAQSINVVSVKLLYLVGVNNAIDFAETLGLTTLKDRSRFGLSLVLGGGEVKLLEMVNAYGAFANDGVKNDLTSILRIEDKSGTILEEYKPRPQQVLEPQHARLLNKMLSDNELRVPVFGRTSALYLPEYNVAVKTGTTNAYHDLWTVGYAPNLAAGVWVGNNDNKPMINKAFSVNVAAPWWQEFMKQALATLPKEKFVEPASVSSDRTMLNGKYISEKVYKIDKISKKLATELTPPEFIEEIKFQEVRSILYFVNKSDPTGPQPVSPETDSQFNSWEGGIKKWLADPKRTEEGLVLSTGLPLTEFDDIHTIENKPMININQPLSGTRLPKNVSQEISVTVQSKFNIKQVDLFFDDLFIESKFTAPFDSAPGKPYLFNFRIADDISTGQHQLRIKVYDEHGNFNEATAEVSVE